MCASSSRPRLLEKLGDAMVKRDTIFGGQTLVERLAHQCVAEAPLLSASGHQSDEAGKTRTPEHVREPVRPLAQCSENCHVELLPDHRRDGENALLGRCERRHAPADDVAHIIGHGRAARADVQSRECLASTPDLRQRGMDEEGITLGHALKPADEDGRCGRAVSAGEEIDQIVLGEPAKTNPEPSAGECGESLGDRR